MNNLFQLGADDKKCLEYEEREKKKMCKEEIENNSFVLSEDRKRYLEEQATELRREMEIRDHISKMKYARQQGFKRGFAEGIELALKDAVKVIELKPRGMSAKQIAMELDLPLEYVQRLVKE